MVIKYSLQFFTKEFKIAGTNTIDIQIYSANFGFMGKSFLF